MIPLLGCNKDIMGIQQLLQKVASFSKQWNTEAFSFQANS